MSDITIVDFPRDGLVYIAKWRTDPEVNQFLRPGLRTVEEVQAWYETYFSREEHKLFALYDNDTLIGYCTLEHIDLQNRSCEIGIVIGEKQYWKKGIGSAAVKTLTDIGCLKVAAEAQFSCPEFGPRAYPTVQYLGTLIGCSA